MVVGVFRTIVLRFAREGFNAAFNYDTSEDDALETHRLTSKFNVKVLYFKVDVLNSDSVSRACKVATGELPYPNVWLTTLV